MSSIHAAELPSEGGLYFEMEGKHRREGEPLITARAETVSSATAALQAAVDNSSGSSSGSSSSSSNAGTPRALLRYAIHAYRDLVRQSALIAGAEARADEMEAEFVAAAPAGFTFTGSLPLPLHEEYMGTYIKQEGRIVRGAPLYIKKDDYGAQYTLFNGTSDALERPGSERWMLTDGGEEAVQNCWAAIQSTRAAELPNDDGLQFEYKFNASAGSTAEQILEGSGKLDPLITARAETTGSANSAIAAALESSISSRSAGAEATSICSGRETNPIDMEPLWALESVLKAYEDLADDASLVADARRRLKELPAYYDYASLEVPSKEELRLVDDESNESLAALVAIA